jgi:hypothetical protein
MRISLICHFGVPLWDVFIEWQKNPKFYTKGEQNDKDDSSQPAHHGFCGRQ